MWLFLLIYSWKSGGLWLNGGNRKSSSTQKMLPFVFTGRLAPKPLPMLWKGEGWLLGGTSVRVYLKLGCVQVRSATVGPTQSCWNSRPVWLWDSYLSLTKKSCLTWEGPDNWKKADKPNTPLQLWVQGRLGEQGLVSFDCSPQGDEGTFPIGIQTWILAGRRNSQHRLATGKSCLTPWQLCIRIGLQTLPPTAVSFRSQSSYQTT